MSQPDGNAVLESPGQEVKVVEGTLSDAGSSETNETTLTHEQALAELSKVRKEAADRRIKLRDAEDKAKKWSEYEESQKTELQKLQEAVAERDKRIAERELEVTRAKIAREFNVADEDLDLLVGDEDSMKRLASRLGSKEGNKTPSPADLMAGKRGAPIGGTSNTFSMDDFIRGTAR